MAENIWSFSQFRILTESRHGIPRGRKKCRTENVPVSLKPSFKQ